MIKLNIPPEYDVKQDDYKSCYNDVTSYSYNGDLYFKKIPITFLKSDCKLHLFLNEYIQKHNLIKENYEIFYKKQKEWYSNLYLYKK